MTLDYTPYQPVVDRGIAVNEHVAESDDAWQICNGGRRLRIRSPQLSERLSRDLELSLDGASQQGIRLIVAEAFSSGELDHAAGCLMRIPKQLSSFSAHTTRAARRSRVHESTDWRGPSL